MGLARDLSMGPKKPRNRVGYSGDYAKLRRLTVDPHTAPAELKALIEKIAGQPTRMRSAEGRAYNEACAAYRRLTGDKIGPEPGTW